MLSYTFRFIISMVLFINKKTIFCRLVALTLNLSGCDTGHSEESRCEERRS